MGKSACVKCGSVKGAPLVGRAWKNTIASGRAPALKLHKVCNHAYLTVDLHFIGIGGEKWGRKNASTNF